MHANPSNPVRILLTRREAAKLCGLCEKTLQNHTYPRGTLIAAYVGRSVRYKPDDVLTWAESLRRTPAPAKGGVQ